MKSIIPLYSSSINDCVKDLLKFIEVFYFAVYQVMKICYIAGKRKRGKRDVMAV